MKVIQVWFEDDKIFILTDDQKTLHQSLLWYERLLNATEDQRTAYKLTPDGIRWEQLDEDVSFESFLYDNPEPVGVSKIFKSFPELNVSAVARKIGIRQSLLAAYINGSKNPSQAREQEIRLAIQALGLALSEV